MKAGDVIKFGRMGFRVRELLFANGKFFDTEGKRDPNFKHEKYD